MTFFPKLYPEREPYYLAPDLCAYVTLLDPCDIVSAARAGPLLLQLRYPHGAHCVLACGVHYSKRQKVFKLRLFDTSGVRPTVKRRSLEELQRRAEVVGGLPAFLRLSTDGYTGVWVAAP